MTCHHETYMDIWIKYRCISGRISEDKHSMLRLSSTLFLKKTSQSRNYIYCFGLEMILLDKHTMCRFIYGRSSEDKHTIKKDK